MCNFDLNKNNLLSIFWFSNMYYSYIILLFGLIFNTAQNKFFFRLRDAKLLYTKTNINQGTITKKKKLNENS